MIFITSLLSFSSLFFTSSWLLSSLLLPSPLLSLVVSLVVVFTVLCCRRILCLVLSSFYICAWCCKMCEETQNIKMERKMLREHEKTRRVFIKSLWWWRTHGSRWMSGRWVSARRSEYEWSYSYDERERSLNSSQMWRLRARFTEFVRRSEVDIPVVASLMVPLVTQVNEVQMKPRLMMAALIIGA